MKSGLFLALTMLAMPCIAEPAPGIVRHVDATEPARPLALSIWYPSDSEASAIVGGNPVFDGAPAAPGAPILGGPFPLVILSHGGLRSATDSGAWLGAALARSGFVVVEVNAPRPADAAAALDEIWQRPRDINRAVDAVLNSSDWAGHVDQSRISAVGFALGGTAALAIAGEKLDGQRYRQSCAEGGMGGPDCVWLAAQGVTLAQTRSDSLSMLVRDPRFASAVAIEPEYLAAFEQETAPADLPVMLISLNAQPVAGGPLRIVPVPGASISDAFPVCTAAGVTGHQYRDLRE